MRRLLVSLVLCLVGSAAASPQAIAGPPNPPAAPQVAEVSLGVTQVGQVIVDPNTGNVYVAAPANNEVLVRNASGGAVATVSVTDPTGLGVDPGTGQVWVSEGTANAITSFDPTTFAVGSAYAIPAAAGCPNHLIAVAGYVWFSFSCGASPWDEGIASLDPSTDAVVPTSFSVNGTPGLVVQPGSPDTLYLGTPLGTVHVLDISDPSAGATAIRTASVCPSMSTFTWSPADGDLLGACSSDGAELFHTDLTAAGSYPTPNPYAAGAGVTPDGSEIATGSGNGTDDDIYVTPAGGTTPVEEYATLDATLGYLSFDGSKLTWGNDDSTLYAVRYGSGPAELTVITNASTPTGRITLNASASGTPGASLSIPGAFALSDGAAPSGVQLSVARTNPDTTVTALPPVMVGPEGTFTIADVPTEVGSTTYTVSYGGDATHAAATATATIDLELPKPTLTLAMSKTSSVAGAALTLTAHLSAHGSNTAVSLSANGAPLSVEHVNGSDIATFTVKPVRTTIYQVAFLGDSAYGATVSGSHTVTVQYAVHESMVGSYGMKSGYHLYHYHSACGTAAHTGCPKMDAVIVPRPAAEIDLQFEEYAAGKWHLLLDRGLKTAANGSCSLLIYYSSTKVENIPMRMSVNYVPPSKTNAYNRGAWMYFKVTR